MSFFSYFSIPAVAVLLIFFLVPAIAYFVVRAQQDWFPDDSALYWKVAAFLAEVLVAGGLIGLITFAGRAKVESNTYELKEQVQKSELAVIVALLDLGKISCVQSLEVESAKKDARQDELCEAVNKYARIHDQTLNWVNAKERIDLLASNKGLTAEVATSALVVTQAVENMIAARKKVHVDRWDIEFYQSPNRSWTLIFLLAGMAVVGVSIKCARAFAEFWAQVKVYCEKYSEKRFCKCCRTIGVWCTRFISFCKQLQRKKGSSVSKNHEQQMQESKNLFKIF